MLSAKVDSLGSLRESTSKAETKPRTIHIVDPAPDPVTALTKAIKRMETSFTKWNTFMQNRLIQLERAQQNWYPPRGIGGWERNRGPPNNQTKTKVKDFMFL